MLINIFDDYQTARNACVAYQRCGKRHQGLRGVESVSYTHLDVYKRQVESRLFQFPKQYEEISFVYKSNQKGVNKK